MGHKHHKTRSFLPFELDPRNWKESHMAMIDTSETCIIYIYISCRFYHILSWVVSNLWRSFCYMTCALQECVVSCELFGDALGSSRHHPPVPGRGHSHFVLPRIMWCWGVQEKEVLVECLYRITRVLGCTNKSTLMHRFQFCRRHFGHCQQSTVDAGLCVCRPFSWYEFVSTWSLV